MDFKLAVKFKSEAQPIFRRPRVVPFASKMNSAGPMMLGLLEEYGNLVLIGLLWPPITRLRLQTKTSSLRRLLGYAQPSAGTPLSPHATS